MFTAAVEENISFNKMIKCALQDIYLHNPNIKWDDIIGLDAAKQLVKEAVVYPIRVRMGSLLGGISIHIHWTSWCYNTHQGQKPRLFSVYNLAFFASTLAMLDYQGPGHPRQFEMLHEVSRQVW